VSRAPRRCIRDIAPVSSKCTPPRMESIFLVDAKCRRDFAHDVSKRRVLNPPEVVSVFPCIGSQNPQHADLRAHGLDQDETRLDSDSNHDEAAGAGLRSATRCTDTETTSGDSRRGASTTS